MKNLNYWNSKHVVITGGTSGLGRQLALQLSKQGAKILIIARNIENFTSEQNEILAIKSDVSLKNNIYPLAGEIFSKLGHVDALFNVASTLGPTPLRLLIDTDCEDFEQVLTTNLMGPFRLSKALLPDMLLRKTGLIVNISSDAALNAYPKWGAYSVSKSALDHLTAVFQAELSSEGIQFLAIDPGDMNTPMHFAAIPDANPDQLRDPAESAQRIINYISQQDFNNQRIKI